MRLAVEPPSPIAMLTARRFGVQLGLEQCQIKHLQRRWARTFHIAIADGKEPDKMLRMARWAQDWLPIVADTPEALVRNYRAIWHATRA